MTVNYYIQDDNGNSYSFENSRSLKVKIRELKETEVPFQVFARVSGFGYIPIPENRFDSKHFE